VQGFTKRADLGLGLLPGGGQERGALVSVEIEAHFVHIGQYYYEMSDLANATRRASAGRKDRIYWLDCGVWFEVDGPFNLNRPGFTGG